MAEPAKRQMGVDKANGDPPSDTKTQLGVTHSMQVIVMVSILLVGCAVGAYFLILNQDDDGDGNIDKTHQHGAPSLFPHLICVTNRSPNYDKKGDVPYTPCEFVIYYPEVAKFDAKVSYDVRGVEVIAGFNTKEPKKADYQKLSSWVGIRYAILDLTIANDFSDVDTKTKEIQDAFSNIRKSYRKPVVAFLGIKVQPKDADATKENGEKIASIAKGAIIIFQTHKPPVDSCIIGINELMITKKNYERLAEGINSSVAISTTIGVVQFDPKDTHKTNIGDVCRRSRVLRRSSDICKDLSFNDNTGYAIKDGIVSMCNTNATAHALFVSAENGDPSTAWRFNIAFFDIELYTPSNDTLCPKLDLRTFYRKGPRQLTRKAKA